MHASYVDIWLVRWLSAAIYYINYGGAQMSTHSVKRFSKLSVMLVDEIAEVSVMIH